MCTPKLRRNIVAGLILAGLGLAGMAASTVTAQPPYNATKEPASFAAKKNGTVYTNKRIFNLPVTLPERERAKLSGLLLYVKTATSEWVRYTNISPQEDKFIYRAEKDGEFWFLVATVDRDGRTSPQLSEARNLPPSLKVVIDTQPPSIDVQSGRAQNGDLLLKCVMADENPNQGSIRLICRGESGERMVEPMEPDTGLFKITRADGVPIRVVGSDMCRNTVSQELLLGKEFGGADPAPGMGRSDMTSRETFSPPQPMSISMQTEKMIAAAKNEFPAIVDVNNTPISPMISPMDQGQRPQPMPQPVFGTEPLPQIPSVAAPFNGPSVLSPINGPSVFGGTSTSNSLPSNRTILNTNQASVDYRIDQTGPSGVGKVQIYVTDDQGQSWKLLKEDFNKRSPVDVKLPGEGLFGVNVVVTNGNGFGGTPPRSGETPSCWIEVDTTPPMVQFQAPELLPMSGGLEIRWTASDKNIASEPINLYYRTSQGGPWQPIAKNLKNDGHYRWSIPKGSGAEFFFKIEAVDQVGNMAQSVTPTPLVLDMTEPRGVVIRVSGR